MSDKEQFQAKRTFVETVLWESCKHSNILANCKCKSGLILGLRPANERRRYKVTPSLIGWSQT